MIRIVEVGPRDGLQNEPTIIPTEAKVAFIDALSLCGVTEIEVSSFVSPKWVPQLADAALVFRQITRQPAVAYSALVPNDAGLARAIEAQVDRVAVFTAASETFTRRNINATIAESIARFRSVIQDSPVPVRGYVSTAWHCPYEGPIAPPAVLPVCLTLLELGCHHLSIGDTIGKANPDEVSALLDLLLVHIRPDQIALHFHDTFGHAVANVERGYAHGIRNFDSSAGGIGGCPYAPGATGNVSTQALATIFSTASPIDMAKLETASALLRPWLSPPGGNKLPAVPRAE